MKDNGVNSLAAAATSEINLGTTSSLPIPSKAATMSGELKKDWNTKNLGARLGVDLTSAACSASLVAPLISIIDKSIMENASGVNTLAGSLKNSFTNFLLRPHTILFSKPAALIFMLYGGTYLTANTLDTFTSTVQNKPATHVTSGTTKFAASSAANIGICIYKDQVFVKLFGPSGPPRPVPLPTYALFAIRDCFTIFASFNVPPVLGPAISQRLSKEWQKTVSGNTIAQFVAPAAVQVLSTPVHLLGLDLYNRPGAQANARERWELIRKNWGVSVVARICRIMPAFGIGGVVNVKVRKGLMEKLA